MPKEKEEKRKPGIVRRIFKWIGLGLLTVLIILGLVFQAPWKVITLLLIVLAACRILPKPAVKWFWLSVGVVIIALIVWVFLPQETEGWRPYTFDEELAALEAKRAIPDEENAAIIYNQLLGKYNLDVCPVDPNADVRLLLPVREPWKSNEHPRLARWLQGKKREIDKLLEASKIEKCRFPIDADLITSAQGMERLPAVRQWAYWLATMANNDRAEGRADEALEKEIAVLRMAKHQYQQPTLIEMMVGISIEALALGQFNRFAVTDETTEEHLGIIEEALEEIKHDWSYDLSNILELEKLSAKNLWAALYEINPEGKTRLSRDPTAAIRAQFPEDVPPLTYWQRKLTKAGAVLAWFFVPSTPQKLSKIIDASYEKLYKMTEPHFDWQKEPKKFSLTSAKFNYRFTTEMLVYILEPTYHRIHDLYLRLMTDKKGSRIIIALRRYKNQNGFWPKGLDDIKSLAPAEIFVDPFNNGSFVYKLTDDSFILYSRGKNNIDEKGWYKDGADDWPIWPPPGKKWKTKEKKENAEQH